MLLQQVESILGSIYVYRVHDYVEQIAVVASLEKFLDEHPKVKLVMSLFVPQNVSFLSRDEKGVPGRAKHAGRLAWAPVSICPLGHGVVNLNLTGSDGQRRLSISMRL